jgi:hypothetical protein
MCLHSIGFSYLHESSAPARPSVGRCHLASAPAVSRRSGADAGLASHHAQDPIPSGQSLNDVGLIVGFAWHWFGLIAIKVSFAPTSGHTYQILREFDSLSDLRGLAPVTRARRIIVALRVGNGAM